MEKEKELMENIRRIADAGGGGVVVISLHDWELLRKAYGGNALMQEIAKKALLVLSVGKEVKG